MIARVENITIPTYQINPDEANPMFYEKRNVQGASGKVFPMAMNQSLSNRKVDENYEAIKLENEYISLTLLPRLGGKVYRAYDKVHGYDFIYYNRVIKPALIGNCGPWTSGGIEFNWPQHHRPTTYLPVEYSLEQNADGSTTAWMGETEPMGRTRGRVGITMYPGRSYMQAKIRVYNRSDYTQSFMWWANLAVAVNKDYRAVFPPDIHWSSDHAWALTTKFPYIAGSYKGVDMGEGTDVRDYNNLDLSASFFTYNSKYDFLSGYDFGRNSGTVHIADRHVSPGKKMFSWGVAPFAQAWYNKLTDDDGPYIELMTGVFTRNQPDFSWIAPHEYKSAEQFWYPIYGIGAIKNATLDAALALDVEDDIKLGLNVTGVFSNVRVRVTCRGEEIFGETLMYIKPGDVYIKHLPRPEGAQEHDIRAEIIADDGRVLVSYQADKPEEVTVPEALERTPAPMHLKTNEELYYHALHLFQYRHPYLEPEDYLTEALKRDPKDVRCNQLMALICLHKFDPEAAIKYADAALERLTMRNPNPYDTEAYYIKGVAQLWLGRYDAAYETLFCATWRLAERSQSYALLALISMRRGEYASALEQVEQALLGAGGNQLAYWEKAMLGRLTGNAALRDNALEALRRLDSLDIMYWAEKAVASGDFSAPELQTCLAKPEYALDAAYRYMQAGQYKAAIALLEWQRTHAPQPFPPLTYALGYAYGQDGSDAEKQRLYLEASQMDTYGVLHSRPESLIVLQDAISVGTTDTAAPYYLGNILYSNGRYARATGLFELSIQRGAKFPTVYRNLAHAYFEKRGDGASKAQAGELMQKAFKLDRHDACIFFELCQYMRMTAAPVDERVALFEKYSDLAQARDDNYTNYIEAYAESGNYARAEELLAARMFNSYEGGEGVILRIHSWVWAMDGACRMEKGDIDGALKCFARALEIDANYQEGEGPHKRELGHVYYWQGLALDAKGDTRAARASYKQGAENCLGRASECETMFEVLCLRKLGKTARATALGKKVRAHHLTALKEIGVYPYFATSRISYMAFEQNKALMDEKSLAFMGAIIAACHGDTKLAELRSAASRFPTEYLSAFALNHPALFGLNG